MREVSEVLRNLGDEVVMPRFQSLIDADVHEKAPGELVTIVDLKVEARLICVLPNLVPGSRVLGVNRPGFICEKKRIDQNIAELFLEPFAFFAGQKLFDLAIRLPEHDLLKLGSFNRQCSGEVAGRVELSPIPLIPKCEDFVAKVF